MILDNDAPNVSPTVTITAPTGDPTFTAGAPFITLAGTAADDGSIETVTWFTNRGASGTATGTTAWTAANIPVQMGTTTIIVQATDSAGSSAVDVLTVTLNSVLYTLAEGATGTFFDTDVLLANPNTSPAPVTLEFLKQDGSTLTQTMTLQPLSRVTLLVDSIPVSKPRRCRPTSPRRPACRSSSSARCGGTRPATARTPKRRQRVRRRRGISRKDRRASSRRSCC